ncbi:MAG: hypothetical protein LBE22_10365 [Azoarcus sp.]|nr:hypothetical protein [Azoarcus sp.]
MRAIKKGYYGGVLREPGKNTEVFDVKDGETASWFAPIQKQEQEAKTSEKESRQKN